MTASKRSILIINPNSTASMTQGLEPLVQALGFHDVRPRPSYPAQNGNSQQQLHLEQFSLQTTTPPL